MSRASATFALRLLARLVLATWFGGFTFYAAVVVPDLHEFFGGMETGEVSRRVVVFLYAIGAASLVLGTIVAAIDRPPGRRGKARLGLIAVNGLFLVALVVMHRSLGARLDSGGNLSAFRSFHELYLTVWTGQWLAIVGLMALEAGPVKGDGAGPLSR